MENKKEIYGGNAFLSGPILSPLIRFALPLMLSLLLQAFYGGVDLAVVGQFSPTASVSAVATGSQVMQVITSLITGLTMGVTVLLGKAVGAKDNDRAGQVVAGQIRLFVVMAAVLTVLMILFAPGAAQLMNVPKEAFDETVRYIRICSAGIFFITAYNGISGIFRGLGNSRSPFLFVLIACFINVALDLLFVGGFHLDAAGAALATVIAQAGSVFFSLWYMKKNPLPFSVKEQWHAAKGTVRRILKVGSPIALQDFLTNMSFFDYHQYCQYPGGHCFGWCWYFRKAVCISLHCTHGLYVGPVGFCGPEYGGGEQKTGRPLTFSGSGYFGWLRSRYVPAYLLCRVASGVTV